MNFGYTSGSNFFDTSSRGGVNLTWPNKRPTHRTRLSSGFIGRSPTVYSSLLSDDERPLTQRQLQDRAEEHWQTQQDQWQKQFDMNQKASELAQERFDYAKQQQDLNRKNREIATQEATRAISEGYQQALDEWKKDSGQVMADIRSDYASQSAAAMQRLARLGMGNTTIAPTLKLGYDREKIASLNRWNDMRSKDKSKILQNRINDYLSVYNNSGYQSGGN